MDVIKETTYTVTFSNDEIIKLVQKMSELSTNMTDIFNGITSFLDSYDRGSDHRDVHRDVGNLQKLALEQCILARESLNYIESVTAEIMST